MYRAPYRIVLFVALFYLSACGSHVMPEGGYTVAPDLLGDQQALREKVTSFRMAGRVDHFGEHRVQGKIYVFGQLPDKLRIELWSPLNSLLSLLTVNGGEFALHDLREGRYFHGPSAPCNIARLVNIPLPPADVIAILTGNTPHIEGSSKVTWSRKGGYYVVEINGENETQRMNVGPDEKTLPLKKSVLSTPGGTIFDLTYDRWQMVGAFGFPHEIRARMPAHQTDLLIRYDIGGVESNVSLPVDAWDQAPPPGVPAEEVTCK